MRTKLLIKRECNCGYTKRVTTLLTDSQARWLSKYPIDPGPCPGYKKCASVRVYVVREIQRKLKPSEDFEQFVPGVNLDPYWRFAKEGQL